MPKVMTPSDRFQLRGVGDLMSPAHCMVCNNGLVREGYVDLSIFFDYEGQMYMCFFCVEEAAAIFGILGLTESNLMLADNKRLVDENAELKVELENVNERIAGLDRFLNRSSSASNLLSEPLGVAINGTEAAEGTGTTEDAGSSPESSDAVITGSASGESVTEESVTEQGSDDVSATKRLHRVSGLDL